MKTLLLCLFFFVLLGGKRADMRDSCMDRPGILYRIARMEGSHAKTGIAVTQNNPGNLIFVHQRGATKGKKGFARWKTWQEGLQALDEDLQKKKYRKSAMQRAWTWLK